MQSFCIEIKLFASWFFFFSFTRSRVTRSRRFLYLGENSFSRETNRRALTEREARCFLCVFTQPIVIVNWRSALCVCSTCVLLCAQRVAQAYGKYTDSMSLSLLLECFRRNWYCFYFIDVGWAFLFFFYFFWDCKLLDWTGRKFIVYFWISYSHPWLFYRI